MPISEYNISDIYNILKNTGNPVGDAALTTFIDTLVNPLPSFIKSFGKSVIVAFFSVL